MILEPLGLDPDAHSDAFNALVFGNPWGYLQKFAEAGGNLNRLSFQQKEQLFGIEHKHACVPRLH